MFLRFSKGSYIQSDPKKYLHTIRKCVLLGNSLVMEYGGGIVGVAKLTEETPKQLVYTIVVASGCELGGEVIARYIKNMIGRANKFSVTPSTKRRSYYVEMMDCSVLPVIASITFQKV